MVKRFIWISAILLTLTIWLGCAGTRTVDKQKTTEKVSESNESLKEIKSSEESKKGSFDFNETKEKVDSVIKTDTEEKKEEVVDKVSEKKNTETSSKKHKRTEYYENGNKKSESEYSEDISKIVTERDSLKKQVGFYKNKFEDAKIKSESAYNKIKTELSEVRNTHNELQESQSKINKELSSSSNKTNREFTSFAWYFLAACLGFALCLLLQYAWKKIKTTQWYIKLITYTSKKS